MLQEEKMVSYVYITLTRLTSRRSRMAIWRLRTRRSIGVQVHGGIVSLLCVYSSTCNAYGHTLSRVWGDCATSVRVVEAVEGSGFLKAQGLEKDSVF